MIEIFRSIGILPAWYREKITDDRGCVDFWRSDFKRRFCINLADPWQTKLKPLSGPRVINKQLET